MPCDDGRQFQFIQEISLKCGIQPMSLPGFEALPVTLSAPSAPPAVVQLTDSTSLPFRWQADDLLATYATRAESVGVPVVVVSPDKDMLQLVSDGRKGSRKPSITVYNPVKRKVCAERKQATHTHRKSHSAIRPLPPSHTVDKPFLPLLPSLSLCSPCPPVNAPSLIFPLPIALQLMREADTVDYFGVPPRLVAEFQALTGDRSDNIIGVRIPKQEAASLLNQYGSLEALFQHVEDVQPDSTRAKIEQFGPVKLGRNLAVCGS